MHKDEIEDLDGYAGKHGLVRGLIKDSLFSMDFQCFHKLLAIIAR